jgi:acyl carrier protein
MFRRVLRASIPQAYGAIAVPARERAEPSPADEEFAMIPSPLDLVAEALDCDPASLHETSGLGHHPLWDSVGHLSVMMALEQHYGVEISDQTIRRFESLREIVAHHAGLAG